MLPGAQPSVFSKDGVGARAGLAHAVLDVGQRANGELQAAWRNVRLRKPSATRRLTTWWPSRSRSHVHAVDNDAPGRQCRNAMPISFHLLHHINGNYFLGTPANSARAWVTASRKSLLHLLLGSAPPPRSSVRRSFPAHHRRLRQRLPGPPLLADREVVDRRPRRGPASPSDAY